MNDRLLRSSSSDIYALWVAQGREVKCKVADKALANFKARVRQLTGRSGGGSMEQVVEQLRPYLLGWKAYFGLAQTPQVWRRLDKWLRRHRLRRASSRALPLDAVDPTTLPPADDQASGFFQRCGSSSSMRLFGWLGSRSSTSRR